MMTLMRRHTQLFLIKIIVLTEIVFITMSVKHNRIPSPKKLNKDYD